MSHHKRLMRAGQAGFTLVELMVVIVLVVLVSMTFYELFISNLKQYLSIQKDGTSVTALTAQSMRVATVVRGLTGIVSAGDNTMTLYSYFYPADTYVSQVRYYISGGSLLVDVARMSANPPIGSVVAGSTKTYTIVQSFTQPSGTVLFTYYDASGTALDTPISDFTTVKSIQINMATSLAAGGNQSLNQFVSLRNRKTNL